MANKIRILKGLDSFVGSLLTHTLPAPQIKHSIIKVIDRILFIRPGGIGDAVLLIPAFLSAKAHFPNVSITVLAEKRNSSIFSLCPDIDAVLHYDNPRQLAQAFVFKPDVVIDTEQWHRLSAIVARLTRAALAIGYGTNERARLFTHPIAYSHDDYETDSFFNLLAPLGINPPNPIEIPFLSVPRKDQEVADQLVACFNKKPFVSIFPGASIPERRWGASKFAEVSTRLVSQGYHIVIIGGKEDQKDGDSIAASCGGLNLAGKTSLVESAAVIELSSLLVSGDSGVLHIGVGLDKPTVSLFGPGIAKKWAPRGPRHIVINKELPCSPCTRFGYTPKCPINAKCMTDISVDEVLTAALKLLNKS